MSFVIGDRVQDTASAVSGTTVTLNNSPPAGGYQSFNSGIGDGNSTFYCILDGTHWEVSYGAYTNSGATLARAATPISSSNGGSQVVTFSGTINVFCVDPSVYLTAAFSGRASGRVYTNNLGAFSAGNTRALATGTVWYMPVFIGQPFSSVVLHFNLASAFAGTSTVDIGLYSNLNGAPNARLGQQTGINTGTGGSTGDNATSTITPSAPQPPGWYWLAIVSHTNGPTLVYCNDNSSITSFGAVINMGQSSTADGNQPSGWQQTSATLPSTAGSLSAIGGSGACPALGVVATL